IVSIVTPPGLHAEMACAAMEAGKHVLLEKPVALDMESAKRIRETQARTGKVITVNHMIRYNPIIRTLADIGQSGNLGKLRHVTVNNYAQDEGLAQTHWFWNRDVSGGIFIEHGVHFFDIVNALAGETANEVFGSATHRNDVQQDRVAALVKYDNGLIANYYHAFSGPGLFEKTTIQLAYDLARVEIEGWMPLKGKVDAMVNTASLEQLSELPGWSVTATQSLTETSDDSRPEGWGEEEPTTETARAVRCNGVEFDVQQRVMANFELPQTKGQVYGLCVQEILQDVIMKIENPAHNLTITLEDAVAALDTAVKASR
ncbi:MAG: Gfo/Idh/MocA family oxidoreductase, partial [Sphingobacteriales bacterium]